MRTAFTVRRSVSSSQSPRRLANQGVQAVRKGIAETKAPLGRWFWWPQVVYPRGDDARPVSAPELATKTP